MGVPLSQEAMQQAINAFAECHGNETAAARSLGLAKSTFQNRLERARDADLEPIKPPKPRIRVPARSVYRPTPGTFGKAITVLVWGDAHDCPAIPDKSRFANAGRLAEETGPDFIVDIGDTMDLDSLSRHAIPGSQDDRERPYWKAEVGSLTEALNAFDEHAPREIPRYHLHGNHEYRAWRYENLNPTAQGVFTTELDQVFARFDWTVMPFREWLFLGQVGFTHAPISAMGREMGGIMADQTVAREATHSIVWGHTHKGNVVNRPKVGIGHAIKVFNTGSFMPQGYIKQYAGMSMTGWTYGCHLLTIRDGEIESVKTFSELELRERYA